MSVQEVQIYLCHKKNVAMIVLVQNVGPKKINLKNLGYEYFHRMKSKSLKKFSAKKLEKREDYKESLGTEKCLVTIIKNKMMLIMMMILIFNLLRHLSSIIIK